MHQREQARNPAHPYHRDAGYEMPFIVGTPNLAAARALKRSLGRHVRVMRGEYHASGTHAAITPRLGARPAAL